MAITLSTASLNLLNAVQKKNQDGPVEKKMAEGAGLQRAALGNISNKGVLLTRADTQKGLKDKKVAYKVRVKRPTAVVHSLNHQPTVTQIHYVEPVLPVEPAESSVSMAPFVPVVDETVDICEAKKLPTQQEPIIEVEEEVQEAFSNRMSALMLCDIDEEDGDNPQLVSEYAKDIYAYMMALETQIPIHQNHLSKQPEVTARMRCILVDWLVQVNQKFHLLQETLFLTVAVLDRYLQVEHVPKTKLQLVGVASMWIASKYEEVYAPEVSDLAYVTDHACTKAEICSMECSILRALDFSFGRPLPIHFLRRFSKAGDVDARMHNLAKYFMELAMVPCETAHIKPSFMAAGALRLAQKLLGDYTWGSLMVYYTNYDEATLAPLMSKLAQIAMNAGSGKTIAVKTKYQSSKLMKVSMLDELKSDQLCEVASWPTTPLFP